MGGLTVESKQQAAAVESIPRVAMKIRTGQRGPVQVGEEVRLPACVGRDVETAAGIENAELRAIEAATGRPCPRVELDEANDAAAAVLGMLMREDAARAFPVWWQLHMTDSSQVERQAVLNRALLILGDREVTDALYPKPKGK